MIDPDELLKEIEAAFEDVAIGDAATLTQAAGPPYVPVDSIPRDTETDWRLVPGEKLAREMDGIYFLDATGMRFYLPAFLREAVLSRFTAPRPVYHSVLLERLTFCLSDPVSVKSEKYTLLTVAQRRAVAMFLEWAAGIYKETPCSEALRFWAGTTTALNPGDT